MSPGRARAAAGEARAAGRRAAFFAAAERQFERFGYRKTTVEEICRDAGVSKRTFYETFDDKADLAAHWILDASLAIVSRWEAAATPGLTARAKLERFLDEYARLGRERPVFGQMINDPDFLRAFGRLADDRRFLLLVDLLRRILAEGTKRGEFRRLDPDRVTWIVYSLLDTVYYLIPATGARKGPLEDARLARELRAFVVHGLLAPEGRSRP